MFFIGNLFMPCECLSVASNYGNTKSNHRDAMTTMKMKYSNYLPLINAETGVKFVLWGGWYAENQDGTITLESGKLCKKWENFPK